MERPYKPTRYVLRRSVTAYVTCVTLPGNLSMYIYLGGRVVLRRVPHIVQNTFPNEYYPGYVNNKHQTKELHKPRLRIGMCTTHVRL
jgi:hypothetical protein